MAAAAPRAGAEAGDGAAGEAERPLEAELAIAADLLGVPLAGEVLARLPHRGMTGASPCLN